MSKAATREGAFAGVFWALLAILAVGLVLTSFGEDDEDDPDAPAHSTAAGASKGRANRGWVPASAREVRTLKQLRAAVRPGRSVCEETEDLLDLAKSTAGGFEAAMRDATRISDAEERRISKEIYQAVLRTFRKEGWAVDAPRDVARYGPYLRALFAHVLKAARHRDLPYTIHIVRSDVVNAAAIAGGHVFVHTGMLDAVASEAELVAVIGHEIEHVERRHVVAAYQYAKAAFGGDVDQLVAQMLLVPMSSEHEHEADLGGTQRAERAQYDPLAAARFWARQAKEHRRAKHGKGLEGLLLGSLDRVLSSHPPNHVRCARNWATGQRVLKKAHYLRYYVGDSNVRARAIGPKSPR